MIFTLRYVLLFLFGGMIICFASKTLTPQGHHESCTKILGSLANEQSLFVMCLVHNSTPFKSCTNCSDKYELMTEKYKLLVSNCSDLYINQNRLNIVSNMQNNLVDMWNKAFCYDCFEGENLSNSTITFNKLETNFTDCLNKNLPPQTTCTNCTGDYILLNDFFKKMEKEKQGKICYDTQDAMNRSRTTWSKDLKCCHREYSMTLFIIASTLFGAIPFAFYLGMYAHTKRRERNHEVIDSNYVSENRETVASTANTITPTTSANPPTESEPSTSGVPTRSINKKQPTLPTTEVQKSGNLIVL